MSIRQVAQAFEKLGGGARPGGSVPVAAVRAAYNPRHDPRVQAGAVTAAAALAELLDDMSGGGGEGGSVRVPFEAFRDYYASLSAAVDDDSFFTLMLFNAWDLAGGLTHATARSRGGRQHSTTGRAPAPGSGLKQRGHHPAGIGFGATSIYHR